LERFLTSDEIEDTPAVKDAQASVLGEVTYLSNIPQQDPDSSGSSKPDKVSTGNSFTSSYPKPALHKVPVFNKEFPMPKTTVFLCKSSIKGGVVGKENTPVQVDTREASL